MKVADLTVANAISSQLDKINKERCALVLNITSGGLRIQDSAGTWVGGRKPETLRAIARLLDAELASEEASLRRRAAQIGLILEIHP